MIMNKFTDKEIIDKCKSIWVSKYSDPTIVVKTNSEKEVIIIIKQMYDYVEMNLSHLKKLSEFFNTDNINDDRYAYGGCETCDWGSSYEITLTIRP